MLPTEVLTYTRKSLYMALTLSLPIVITATLIGVVIGLIQAATQVQDQTLPFLGKLVGVTLILMLTGVWMSRELNAFMVAIFDLIPAI